MIGIGDNMKKIMNDKSFWMILIVSIVSLVVLTMGVVYLTRKNTKEFYSAGYIISSTATKTDKYYFSDNTVYKENVFEEYVFKDVDNKEVSTSKDNFIHYLDESLSFMKNGVILDLDNFNENIVPYYNITDKSIIQYNNGGYYIETADKTLVFGNFLGRINDNKYIVVGNDISVKLAGNDSSVSGDYFEILFIEDGIVKVENQEGSYQTISDGTVVYIGDNIKINLGDKIVSYDDEEKLSLSELTIDGNENIDIIPNGVVDKEDGSGSGEGNGSDEQQGQQSGNGQGTGSGEDSDINGDGGSNVDGETTTVLKKEVSVNLIEASSTVNSIIAKFQVIDTAEAIKGNLVLTLVNTTTGETVYTKMLANVVDEQSVIINSLPSDCNYVMTIVDENNEVQTQYFQKSFRTDSLNLKLKREMVTENSLTYSLDFGTQSDVVAARVSLFDEEGNEFGSYKIEKDTDTRVTFDNLTNNTLYNVLVDNVVIKNVQYDELYSTRTSDLTLKNKPMLGEISVKTNNDNKNFTLSMDSVTDDDKAIVKYTYQIFKAEDITEDTITTAVPVYSFTKNELGDELLVLDESKNLFGNVDYRFKIVVQYYDNYRYNEIETRYSDYFQIVGKPTISFEPSEIDINRIAGTITIKDEGCTIPFKGRQCSQTSDAPNNFKIRYYGGTTATRNEVEFIDIDPEKLTLSFDLNGLQESTLYTFEVYADVDLKNGDKPQPGQYIGGFNVTTAGINSLMMQNWEDNGYSFKNPISVNTEMVSTNPDDDSINQLASVKFNLYSGDVSKVIEYSVPIASYTESGNIIDKLYNKQFLINSSMFEYQDVNTLEMFKIDDLDVLKMISGGKLSRYYTIEVTDAFDNNIENPNEFPIVNNVYVYETPAILLLEDQVTSPEVMVEEITNVQTKKVDGHEKGPYEEKYGISYIKQLDDEIVRGYKVTAVFDKNKIESYFATSNPITKINYYAYDSNNVLIEEKNIDFVQAEDYTVYFFLKEGTNYGVKDTELRRGNAYKFAYDIHIDDDGDPNTEHLVFPASRPTSDVVVPLKQSPSIKLYIDNSTNDSVTYKYQVSDYDNALYLEEDKYYMYYTINDNADVYRTEFVNDGSNDLFTLSNLSNGSVYNIGYYSATIKGDEPYKVNIGSYFFDGYYDASEYIVNYNLEYSNFDNRLKIVIEDNEFLDRISAYLLTLKTNDEKYEKVISELETCKDSKCIVIDYKDISSFKGKDITVTLEAFYDTGYTGFGQKSLLIDYFKERGYSDEEAAKSGFVYQTIANVNKGQYFYVINTGYGYSELALYPRGILGFEFNSNNSMGSTWKLKSSNLIDIKNNKFVEYGNIAVPSSGQNVIARTGAITIVNHTRQGDNVSVTPKVLDKMSLTTDDDSFKFTSIIPKVSVVPINAQNNNSLINGAIMDINVSLDEHTMISDFYPTYVDGSDNPIYKFYIDIYQNNGCLDTGSNDCVDGLSLVKTMETDYNNLSDVIVDGLDPATSYSYKISADMNKNGKNVKTPLFDNTKGYNEFLDDFTTLKADEVFNRVNYGYNSSITQDNYSHRELTIKALLKNTINFDVKFELYDIDNNLEFQTIINNDDINNDDKSVMHIYDVTGNEFVFGPGYHRLVVTAITKGIDNSDKELKLFDDKLIHVVSDQKEKDFHKLYNPTFSLEQSAGIDGDFENYIYYITSDITVTDVDKVINNGMFFIELQDAAYNNLCSNGVEECPISVQIKKNASGQYEGICKNVNNPYVNICSVTFGVDQKTGRDAYKVHVKFSNLKVDTNYSVYVHADTYQKNYDNNELVEPNGFVYARKNQYTRSELGFTLGAVTPVAVNKNQIDISFVSSSNLSNHLVGIKYTINVDGGAKVKDGSFGTIIKNGEVYESDEPLDLVIKNNEDYPRISIVTDSVVGTNNYIIMEYFYKRTKDSPVEKLIINGNSTYQYTVKKES